MWSLLVSNIHTRITLTNSQENNLCFENDQEQRWYNLYLKLDQQEGNGRKVHCHSTERGKWPENTETYKPHATALCIVLLDHTSFCTKSTIIINHWCLPRKNSKTTTTQMKDSMRTRLDNLSDQRGRAIWQKGTVLISLFFLATWKDILHLAHISWILCILESKSIANITKTKQKKTK